MVGKDVGPQVNINCEWEHCTERTHCGNFSDSYHTLSAYIEHRASLGITKKQAFKKWWFEYNKVNASKIFLTDPKDLHWP